MTPIASRGPDRDGIRLLTMVNRQDIRTLNEQTRELQNALDDLEELHDSSQRTGVNVDTQAYEEAQEAVKEAVNELIAVSNDMVDRTDILEDDNGETLVDLPNAALERTESVSIPNGATSLNGGGSSE